MPKQVSRRVVKTDDDEIEAYHGSTSLEAKKERLQVMIQRASLGNVYADEVKYGEKPSFYQSTSNYRIRPACEREGTKEAEIAEENKPKLTGWTDFHKIDEVADIPAGDIVRNVESIRIRVKQDLQEQAANLGLDSAQELTLEDTYGHGGGVRRPGKKFAAIKSHPQVFCIFSLELVLTLPRYLPRPSLVKPSASNRPTSLKATTKSKRGKPEQSRPWPPAALVGTLAQGSNEQANASAAKKISQMLSNMPAASQIPAQATSFNVRSATAHQGPSFFLSDPSDFLLKMKATEPKAPEKVEQLTTHGATISLSDDQEALTSSVAVAAVAAPDLDDPSILRIPVTEFSFPATGAFGAGGISTHTDGVPSPATLSGFSAFTGANEQVSVPASSHANDLIGLGISNVDMPDAPVIQRIDESFASHAQDLTLSPVGSLIDSPILDDVKVDVLTTGPDSILNIAGRKYVALDDLLALRDAIESRINAAMAHEVANTTASAPALEPTVDQAAQPILASEITASSMASTAIPTRSTNPFTVREPLADNDANISSTSAFQTDVKRDVTAPESVKASTTTRPKPFASNKLVESKWAEDPSPQPVRPTFVPSDLAVEAKVVKVPSQPAGSSLFTSNKMVESKWANELPSRPATRSIVRPRSPIFGDGKVLGVQASKYEPPRPPQKPDAKRKYHAPGPGFHQLLKDLKIRDSDAKD